MLYTGYTGLYVVTRSLIREVRSNRATQRAVRRVMKEKPPLSFKAWIEVVVRILSRCAAGRSLIATAACCS